jgi:hypothetical protein
MKMGGPCSVNACEAFSKVSASVRPFIFWLLHVWCLRKKGCCTGRMLRIQKPCSPQATCTHACTHACSNSFDTFDTHTYMYNLLTQTQAYTHDKNKDTCARTHNHNHLHKQPHIQTQSHTTTTTYTHNHTYKHTHMHRGFRSVP